MVSPKNRGFKVPSNRNTLQRLSEHSSEGLSISRESPGKGFRHFLLKKDIISFIELLPEWTRISNGLSAVLLAKGEPGCDGWYSGTIVAISAWERNLWRILPPDYYLDHERILKRLGVETIKAGRQYVCKFNASTIRAFQLLHVFLHELGHHYDKITTKSMKEASRGEAFAEEYARRYEEVIWKRYIDRFGI